MVLKKALLPLLLLASIPQSQLQAKEDPTVAILPSDKWCVENGYYDKKTGKDGETSKIPNYREAFEKDEVLRKASRSVGKALRSEAFKPLSKEKSVAVQEKEGEKGDFRVELEWELKEDDIFLNMKAIRKGEIVASVGGTSSFDGSQGKAKGVKKAISKDIPELKEQMKRYLEQIKAKGEKIRIKVRAFRGDNLDARCTKEGAALSEVFEKAVRKAALDGAYKLELNTTGQALFSSVRIPYGADIKKSAKEIRRTVVKACKVISKKNIRIDIQEGGTVIFRTWD